MLLTTLYMKIRTIRLLSRFVVVGIFLQIPWVIGICSPDIESDKSLCPLMRWLDFPCPGCGLTKSILFCYRGDFIKSISYHIFGPVFIAGFLCFEFLLLIDFIWHTDLAERYSSQKILWQIVALLYLLYYLVRVFLYL